jgi:predicted ferric reductase
MSLDTTPIPAERAHVPVARAKAPDITEVMPDVVPAQDLLMLVLVVIAGVMFAINVLPMWLPGLTSSVTGADPKIYWYLARGSAIAAFWLLWLSSSLGVSITNKLTQLWPGTPPAYEIHQYTSLLGLGFALFHGLILMGDHYINFSLAQVLVPFSTVDYKPLWVGIGQVAFYVWALLIVSFYVRKRIGRKAWRMTHYLGYACFLGVMMHGIFSGTDTAATPWSLYLYGFSGVSLLFLTVYRVVVARFPAVKEKPVRQTSTSVS